MASATGVLRAERWLDEVIIDGLFSNQDGALDLELSLPAGMGDVAIMEVDVQCVSIATLAAAATLAEAGARAYIIGGAGEMRDIIGVEEWVQTFTDRLATYFSPDPLVLWRQGELLKVLSIEVDTNASPTVDVTVTAKCVRIRPLETTGLPIQLVR